MENWPGPGQDSTRQPLALASSYTHPLSYSFQELSAFPREVGASGSGLHPVVYPCTALLLLCLFSTIITYILNHRWSCCRKGGCGGKVWGWGAFH